jgi:hypothetical protein
MIEEAREAVRWTLAKGGTLADVLTNKKNFARTPDLAKIYGAAVYSGQGEPQDLPAPREGLLTRAAFLSTGSANTRPIMKGVFIRTALLCDQIPPPPNNASATPIELSPTLTTREIIERLTEGEGTACAGCHKPLINPLGFASENFDALGRARTAQALFDAQGKRLGERPVNTQTTPRLSAGDTRASAGMGDLTRMLVESGRVETCLSKQYFRFTFRRFEDTSDGPVLKHVESQARAGKPLRDVLAQIALRPEFKQRVIK